MEDKTTAATNGKQHLLFCEGGLEWEALLGGANLQKDFFLSFVIAKVSGASARLTQE